MTSGSRTTATTKSGRRKGSSRAEPPRGCAYSSSGGPESLLSEVRPQRVVEDELRVRRLPQEEVRDPLLTRRSDHEIRIGELGRVQPCARRLLGHVLEGDRRPRRAAARPRRAPRGSRSRRRSRAAGGRGARSRPRAATSSACSCAGMRSRRPKKRVRTPCFARSGSSRSIVSSISSMIDSTSSGGRAQFSVENA